MRDERPVQVRLERKSVLRPATLCAQPLHVERKQATRVEFGSGPSGHPETFDLYGIYVTGV